MWHGLNYPATWRHASSFLRRRWNNGTLIPPNFGRSHVIRASSIARRRQVKSEMIAAGKFALSLKYLSLSREKRPRARSLLVSIYSALLLSVPFVIALQDTTAINVLRNEVLLALTNARKLRIHASRTLCPFLSPARRPPTRVAMSLSPSARFSLCLSFSFYLC